MQWNENGFIVPNQTGPCNCEGACISVCPFNPYPEQKVQTEDEISINFLKEAKLHNSKVGRYTGIYAGFSNEFQLTSSSGGITTFILTDLLERGIVQHIFSVKESSEPGVHYEYAISTNKQELTVSSKTRYFPVSLSNVFTKIEQLDGKVAIVGVACFIKAIRLAQNSDSTLQEKIPFLVGIICGGVKSRFFTEYLANKIGVSINHCYKPEFRIKDINSTAGDYSFGCYSLTDMQKKTIKMQKVGDMWGTGLFKANACDYCDDVTTELADISLGDAWIPPFVMDGKGTNIIVTRSLLADKIIQDGIHSKKIGITVLSLDSFLASQQGSYNHRHNGLPYRVKKASKNNIVLPPKRFAIGYVPFDFVLVQFFRLKARKSSLRIWRMTSNSIIFDKKMKYTLFLLKVSTILSHFKKKFASKMFRII
jgi:coenzyme F420-reducing hydrogenase beta subunit